MAMHRFSRCLVFALACGTIGFALLMVLRCNFIVVDLHTNNVLDVARSGLRPILSFLGPLPYAQPRLQGQVPIERMPLERSHNSSNEYVMPVPFELESRVLGATQALKAGIWRSFGGVRHQVAVEEGTTVDSVPGARKGGTIANCEAACQANDRCHSVSYCANACYLKDAELTGSEEHTAHPKCTTFYWQKSEYQRAAFGGECPPGTEIHSMQECQAAVKTLGMTEAPPEKSPFIGSSEGIPKYCSVRTGSDLMYWNTAAQGSGQRSMAPVCRKSSELGASSINPEIPGYACEADHNFVGEDTCFDCPSVGIKTIEQCATLCSQKAGCTVFVHNNQSECYLKSNVARIEEDDPKYRSVSCQSASAIQLQQPRTSARASRRRRRRQQRRRRRRTEKNRAVDSDAEDGTVADKDADADDSAQQNVQSTPAPQSSDERDPRFSDDEAVAAQGKSDDASVAESDDRDPRFSENDEASVTAAGHEGTDSTSSKAKASEASVDSTGANAVDDEDPRFHVPADSDGGKDGEAEAATGGIDDEDPRFTEDDQTEAKDAEDAPPAAAAVEEEGSRNLWLPTRWRPRIPKSLLRSRYRSELPQSPSAPPWGRIPAPPPSSARFSSVEPITAGFFFAGFGSGGFCQRVRPAVTTLNHVGLACRQKIRSTTNSLPGGWTATPTHEPLPQCKIGFVGDATAVARVRQECPDSFDTISVVDISKCQQAIGSDLRAQAMCIRALSLAPFDYNVFLDLDAVIMTADVENIFPVLQGGFDFAAAFGCCSKLEGDQRATKYAGGWEMETDVIGFTKTKIVAEHAKRAIGIYLRNLKQSNKYASESQSAETESLAQTKMRFMLLPPNFNVKDESTTRWKDLPPALAHFHYSVTLPYEKLMEMARKIR